MYAFYQVWSFITNTFFSSVKDGVFRQYRGSRDKDSFISFVEKRNGRALILYRAGSHHNPTKWRLYLLSSESPCLLRSMHNTLVEDYGIPYWGSYIIFGLLTMLVGALLGLLLVFAIDFFCPSRMGYQPLPKSPNAPGTRE
ncbi:hypothetical protein JTE90_019474, partial [Oedothorax gibbosus]